MPGINVGCSRFWAIQVELNQQNWSQTILDATYHDQCPDMYHGLRVRAGIHSGIAEKVCNVFQDCTLV